MGTVGFLKKYSKEEKILGSYTIIADVSRSIVEMLRKTMIPEPIQKEEGIGLCSPNDRGNHILGIYLYDLEENPEQRSKERRYLDREHYKEPPISINLYYMLFAYSDADPANRIYDEQRILGRAIQQMNENRRLTDEYLKGTLKEKEEFIELAMIPISLEEKVRIWSLFQQPYRICAFYKAGPVFLESTKIFQTKRVKEVHILLEEKGKNKT